MLCRAPQASCQLAKAAGCGLLQARSHSGYLQSGSGTRTGCLGHSQALRCCKSTQTTCSPLPLSATHFCAPAREQQLRAQLTCRACLPGAMRVPEAPQDVWQLTGWRFPSLQGVYRSFVSNAKFVNAATTPHIAFMASCVVEVFGLDMGAAYEHAFTYIKQLAVLLRAALSMKTKDAFREVYCWQTVNCLELWAKVLAAHADKQVRACVPLHGFLAARCACRQGMWLPHGRSYCCLTNLWDAGAAAWSKLLLPAYTRKQVGCHLSGWGCCCEDV